MPVRDDLLLRLEMHLRATLPETLTEVTLPAMRWRQAAGRLTLVPISAVWAEVASEQVAPAARPWLATHGVELRLAVPAGDEDEEPALDGDGFSGFMADPGNELALAAARRLVESPGIEHNPLYLHGPAGSGKTRLLQAIATTFRAATGDEAVVVVDGGTFVAAWAQQLAERRRDGVRGRIRRAALFALDGVDALAGRGLAQEELFHLINDGLEAGMQLVFTARQPPRRLNPFEERLATRLGWGLTVGLEVPQVETRLAALRRLAGSAADDLAEADLLRVVTEQAPDMHRITALARRLAEGEGLAHEPTTAVGFDRIVSAVAQRTGLRPGDLAGKRRHQGINRARGLALLLGRRLTGHSLEALGGMVGGRSHATVLHAVRQTEQRIQADPTLRRLTDEITQELLAD
jgi:chromosomal replication initiator protein